MPTKITFIHDHPTDPEAFKLFVDYSKHRVTEETAPVRVLRDAC